MSFHETSRQGITTTDPSTHRVKRHREGLRAAGMRPVQIWVPDTRSANFQRKCERQTARIAQSDADDRELHTLLDAALEDIDDWQP